MIKKFKEYNERGFYSSEGFFYSDINENINWDFYEEEDDGKYPKRVKFRRTGGVIPFNFYFKKIPKKYIRHGSIRFNENEPIMVIDKYGIYNIVRYTDENGKIVQLGFLDKDLEYNINENQSNNFVENYETFTDMVVKNHNLFDKTEEIEFTYNTKNPIFNNNNKQNNYILPYEKNKPY